MISSHQNSWIREFKKFSPERFDFKIEMQTPTLQEELEITEKIVEQWMDRKPTYFGEELRKYLQWIKSYEPEMPVEIKKKAAKVISMYIEMNKEEMLGSMRKKESVVRIAVALAKIYRRSVKVEDFFQALQLLNPTFNGTRLEAIRAMVLR